MQISWQHLYNYDVLPWCFVLKYLYLFSFSISSSVYCTGNHKKLSYQQTEQILCVICQDIQCCHFFLSRAALWLILANLGLYQKSTDCEQVFFNNVYSYHKLLSKWNYVKSRCICHTFIIYLINLQKLNLLEFHVAATSFKNELLACIMFTGI